MSPPKPLVRAKQRSPAAIQKWLEWDYPAIAKRAKSQRAMICWGDETGVPGRPAGWGDETGISNQDPIGRSWAPRGQTPVVRRPARRVTPSMISAVSNRGLMRFMLDAGALNVDRFIAFLRRLVKDAGQKVFLVVDNLKVHKAHKVQAWARSHAHAIELFHLPSPDRGPGQALRARPQPDRVSDG
jgi:hypothetical protein